jgi:predicted RNA-binding protein Jag
MAMNKTAAIYLSLAIASGLCATAVRAQTVDADDVADYPVEVDNHDVTDPEMKADTVQEQEPGLEVLVDKRRAQDAVEEAAQETEQALQRQEEELAHDQEMSRKIEHHDAEMAEYLKAQRQLSTQ